MKLQRDYLRHEYIYATSPDVSGWNPAPVDQEILSYVDELMSAARLVPPPAFWKSVAAWKLVNPFGGPWISGDGD